MNTKNLIYASLIGAAVSLLVNNIPFINFINCLLCVGFWGSALLAVYIYKRMTGEVTLSQAIWVGVLTGVFAGVFGYLLSFAGVTGLSGILNNYRAILPPEWIGDVDMNLGTLELAIFNIGGIFVDIFFGAIGGLIGGLIFRPKTQAA